jgi:hypothetical protein
MNLFFAVCVASLSLLSVAAGDDDAASLLSTLHLPTGFRIELYASGMNQPRSLDISPTGTVFVGSLNDSVYAVSIGRLGARGRNRPGCAQRRGLSQRHWRSVHRHELGIASRVRNVESNLTALRPEVVSTAFF